MTEATTPGDDLRRRLTLDRYPRSARYDPAWMVENMMGPNAVWLAEALAQVMPLAPGERVLDLGCGKAISSIFLAREFGVQVWAADLWIKPTPNLERVRAAGLAESVFPIAVEAHALPFAEGFFDAIVSLDAYHYFGAADLYLAYLAHFLRPGGRIGIVVPGLREEQDSVPPPHLAQQWQDDFCSFHSPAWWRRHWQRSGAVAVERADFLPHGWEDWLLWSEICDELSSALPSDTALLRADGGRLLGFSRVVAAKATPGSASGR